MMMILMKKKVDDVPLSFEHMQGCYPFTFGEPLPDFLGAMMIIPNPLNGVCEAVLKLKPLLSLTLLT
jgi:hypothetical protein